MQNSESKTNGRKGGEGEYRMTKRSKREGITKTEAKNQRKKLKDNIIFPRGEATYAKEI